MVGKSESQSSGQISFPRRAKYELVFQFWYCEPSVKNQCWEGGRRGGGRERDRRPNFVFFVVWSALIVTWLSCIGPAKIASFLFLVLFKYGERRVSPRFHLFFLMLIRGMRRRSGFKFFLHDPRDGKILLRSSAS